MRIIYSTSFAPDYGTTKCLSFLARKSKTNTPKSNHIAHSLSYSLLLLAAGMIDEVGIIRS